MDFQGMVSLQKLVQSLLDLIDISGTLTSQITGRVQCSFPFTSQHPCHRQPYHVDFLQLDLAHFLQDSQVNQL